MDFARARMFVSSLSERDVIECRDPATGERLGEVPVMTREDVEVAVARGRRAQASWATTTFAERGRVLRTLLDAIVAHQDEICRLAVHGSGKTMLDVVLGEVWPVCEKIRYALVHGERDLRPERRSPGWWLHKTATLVHVPRGVIGAIGPSRFPFYGLLSPVVPGLYAGNAVVVKVSELASWSSLAYLDLIHDALRRHGHDAALVQVVTGDDRTATALMDAGIDTVFVPGSSRSGAGAVATTARSWSSALERGGTDALVVCDDADLDRVLDAALPGVFGACGPSCTGVERLYVFDAVYEAFVRLAEARVRRLRQGPPLDDLVDCGAMATARDVDVLQELVDDAVAQGARVLVGGRRRSDLPGHYFEPTLVVDVDPRMRIVREAVFGPVMVVVRVDDEAQAIELANESACGIGSTVFTRDRARGDRIASRLRAATSVVNDHAIARLMQALPWGGSGSDPGSGREGLRACCHAKVVVNDRFAFGKTPAIHPVREHTYDLVESTVRALYGRGLRHTVRASWDTLRNLVHVIRER